MIDGTDDIVLVHPSGNEVRTAVEAFQHTARMHPDKVALRTPGGHQEVTWREYARRVEAIASGLAELGVRRGDTVGLMLTNRPEFNLVDTAITHLGAIPFSVYNTSAPEQLQFLFTDAGNKVVVTEQVFLAPIAASRVTFEHIVTVDGPADGALELAEIESNPAANFDFEASWRAVRPDDLVTLVYTSGTTGPPKGVEVTQRNAIAAARAIAGFDLGFEDRAISYLPSAHIADRISTHGANQIFGVQITAVGDLRDLMSALSDVRPTMFVGVPRVWMKIKAGIEAKLAAETNPITSKLAAWSFAVGARAARATLNGTPRGRALQLQYRVADTLVFSKVRTALGFDQLRLAFTGAAAIPVEILEYFTGLGIPLLEIWGMSETIGLGAMTTADNLKIGTVGKPVTGVEIRLAADGEVLVRGPIVMRGYRNQPEKTAETIDSDGWMATGDIGKCDDNGNLTIVDRKKELIVNSSGKNLAPNNIENAVKASSSLIAQVVAIGNNQSYVTALVTLDPDVTDLRAEALGVPGAQLADLAAHPKIVEEATLAVRAGNAKLSTVEQVKRFSIIPSAWVPGGDELTPTMKLRRTPIASKYADTIKALYAERRYDGVINVG
ncbi:long-chain fatty acid--CoA ligase [Rhodococcus sp. MS16]|uniref:AMP-dependent synthetase/ligase n=1 Tax=Rhodococcus sp. MS16 TaxID=2579941 RepID=UPI001562D4D7|nr:long-chain fatty acid--CoA ligase [Rhodococcus sp. MS16]NRI64709.1 long-chain fatty acid--CoA ligase [Rhodococcus sp. MS16]